MDDMEQAIELPSTAHALGTGHGTPWWWLLVVWQGKVRKLGVQLKLDWIHETSFHPLIINEDSERLFPTLFLYSSNLECVEMCW